MKIVVFGASGRVGRLVIEKLLAQGYDVVAFVHSTNNFANNSKLTVLQGDIHSKNDVAKALTGCDVVMSTLGSWGTPSKDIVSTAMQHIIPAMKEAGLSRIITLTGTAVRASTDVMMPIDKMLYRIFGLLAPKIQKDGEAHVLLLEASNLEWTILRSPAMRSRGQFGSPKLSLSAPGPFATAHRQDVASAMVDQIGDSFYVSKAPFITS